MKLKSIFFIIILLIMVFSLAIGSATAKTENIKLTDKNTKYSESDKQIVVKTTTSKFVITHTMIADKKFVDPDSPYTGYLTVKSKNPKLKIKTIKVEEWNINRGLKWKTYKINSNKKTIKLGKITNVHTYKNGVGWQKPYKITY